MGTNYYATSPESCYGDLHIGKSSSGWCFTCHIIPSLGIYSWEMWKLFLDDPTVTIKNEYNQIITLKELIDKVENRVGTELTKEIVSSCGYTSFYHFLESNSAIIGPKNLLRHKITKDHCVGHGSGTWDHIIVEFS